MRQTIRHATLGTLILLMVGMMTGCDADTIQAQARSSLSSFVTGIVTTAINDAIND